MHSLVLESREDLTILAKHLHSDPRAHEILLDQKRAARQHRAGDPLDVFNGCTLRTAPAPFGRGTSAET